MNDRMGHSTKACEWIRMNLKIHGVEEYRFCIENDCYVCDKLGNFYSVCHRQQTKSGRLREKYRIVKLHGSIDRYGYITYRISINGVRKHLKAHRLMMNAWIKPEPTLCVNHIDGNKKNNALSNLEWCTVAENNAHAIRTGLVDPHAWHGEYSVPTSNWMSIYILNRHCGWSLSKLGRLNNCTHGAIKAIIDRIDKIMPEVIKDGN